MNNGADTIINNSNRITKTSPGTLNLRYGAFNNTGTVGVDSGVLEIHAGTNNNIFSVASGATIRVPQSGSYTLGTGAKLLGVGTYQVSAGSGGVLTVNEDLSVNRLELNTNGYLAGTGNVTVNQSLVWTGGYMNGPGTTTIAASATAAVAGDNVKYLQGRTLNNLGTMTWTDEGDINLQFLGGNSVINTGGTFDVQTDADVVVGTGGPINNTGTWIKSSPVSTGTTQIRVAFNNTGTVSATSGVLELFGGGTSTGDFNAASDGTIHFTQSTHNLNTGVSFTGSGFTRIVSGTFNVQGAIVAQKLAQDGGVLSGPGSLVITGTYDWVAGSISNTIGTGGVTIASGRPAEHQGECRQSTGRQDA